MKKSVLNFIASGIACNCITLINSLGLIEDLKSKNGLSLNPLLKSSLAIQSALLSLEKLHIVKRENLKYYLTSFGDEIVEQIGLIKMLFEGYGPLMAMQTKIVKGKIFNPQKLLNGAAIADASIQFSENTVIPILVKEMKELKIKNKICDFGCGSAVHLVKICQLLNLDGLGIDLDPNAIKIAKKSTANNKRITILQENITLIKEIDFEVEAVMQCHVMHDINPAAYCIKIINTTLKCFPNLKYFFYVDVVSPSEKIKSFMPGFDYVHGLQGIKTRNYEETIQMLKSTNFEICKEMQIPSMPNTFYWLLKSKNT